MKVKQYFNTVDLPNRIPFEAPSGQKLAARDIAVGGFGEALGQAGEVYGKFLEEKRKLDESLEAARVYGDVRTKVKALEVELEKNPNDKIHVAALNEGIGKITTEALSNVKSKDVQAALTKSFAGLRAERINAGQDFAFKTYLARSSGEYLQTLHNLEQAYITSDDKGRAKITGEAEALIKSVATTLGRDPDEDFRKFQRDVVVGAVKADAVIDAKATLTKIQAGQYPGLWEQDRPVLIRMSQELAKTQEVEESKARVDTLTKEMLKLHGKDYNSMYEALANPESWAYKFFAKKELTSQEAQDVNTLLKQHQSNYLAGKQMTYHKRGQEAFVRLEKGTLTPGQLREWVALDEMTDEQGRVYLNALEVKANKIGGGTTDNDLFIHRFNQIHAAEGNTAKLLELQAQLVQDAKNKMFKHEDYVQLWNLTKEENSAVFKDDYFKMTDNWFKQQLGFQEKIGAMGELMSVAPNPEAATAYVRAKMELIEAYKEKSFRGPDLFKKGIEIMGGKKLPLTDLLSGKPKKKPEPPPSPTVSQEAPADMKAKLPVPNIYFKQYGSIPLYHKQTGRAFKTDGKTWWEIKNPNE